MILEATYSKKTGFLGVASNHMCFAIVTFYFFSFTTSFLKYIVCRLKFLSIYCHLLAQYLGKLTISKFIRGDDIASTN